MTQPVSPDSIRSLWQSMPTTPVIISPAEMRVKAKAFERRVQRRNTIEYVAAVLVAGVFSWYATFPATTPLWPIANILVVLGTLYVVWNLHRVGRANAAPASASFGALVDFHRAELVRQRDALATVWRWYLAPFVPGMILWFIAMGIELSKKLPLGAVITTQVMAAMLMLAVFLAVFLLNLLGAARLQRQIDALDRYKELP
jgi:hypothetical protein